MAAASTVEGETVGSRRWAPFIASPKWQPADLVASRAAPGASAGRATSGAAAAPCE